MDLGFPSLVLSRSCQQTQYCIVSLENIYAPLSFKHVLTYIVSRQLGEIQPVLCKGRHFGPLSSSRQCRVHYVQNVPATAR